MAVPWNRGPSFFFPGELSFEEKYSDLEDVRVEYEERGDFDDPAIEEPKKEGFNFRTYGPDVRCGNPKCLGGYKFQNIVDAVIASSELKGQGRMRCGGVVEMGRRHQRPCVNSINYTVTLIPKQK